MTTHRPTPVLPSAGVAAVKARTVPMNTMPCTISPIATADLAGMNALFVADLNDLLGHVRWCAHTAHAVAWKACVGDAVVGVCCGYAHGASAWITRLEVDHGLRGKGIGATLLQAMLQRFDNGGTPVMRVTAPKDAAEFFTRFGFQPECDIRTYERSVFHEATRPEVVALEPQHLMGLWHLDRTITGEDRRALLMEQLYLGQVYAENGRVRGALLPLNGEGLVIADSNAVGFELLRWLLPLRLHIHAPATNEALHAHLTELGNPSWISAIRLVRGTPAPWQPERVFAGGGWG